MDTTNDSNPQIATYTHVIDCDAAPYIPTGWKVESHKKGGELTFDPAKIGLYLSKEQEGSKRIEGNKLREEMEDKPVLNANVLDYLLSHPGLIPDSWKRKAVFFWGTIYRDRGGYLCVRYLYWLGDGWDWNPNWLGDGWRYDYPAAVVAS